MPIDNWGLGSDPFGFHPPLRSLRPGGSRPKPEETPEENEIGETLEAPAEPEKKPRAILRNPKWEAAVFRCNENTDISVEGELPAGHDHKTKICFELFAKTPGGPERISGCEGYFQNGKAVGSIPVYQPQYRDESGKLLAQVQYFFTAKHSMSDLLRDEKVVREVGNRFQVVGGNSSSCEDKYSEAPDYSEWPDAWLPYRLVSRVEVWRGTQRAKPVERRESEAFPLVVSASEEIPVQYWHQSGGKAWALEESVSLAGEESTETQTEAEDATDE